ncbi:MAG: hypothetical protein ACM32E_08320 [Gemmatimonadota bacterium]
MTGPAVNLVPSQYRNVSVADVPVPLTEPALRGFLLGRAVYRRTRYLIARHGGAGAVVEVSKDSEQPLFSPVTAVTMLAGPEETALVDAPEADTGVPTQLARVAASQAPGARCVIVCGRYGHVNFILDPAPVRIRVVEVVPPWPPKLVDQLTRVLDLAEDLPPVELVPELVNLEELAAAQPARHYLFPCRAGETGQRAGTGLPGENAEGTGAGQPATVEISYLDEIPERASWTLVGCARSKSIHDWFYRGDVPVVDMCPRNLTARARPGPEPLLTKCCLLEDRVTADNGLVVVPWGASMAQIREGLDRAVAAAVPAAGDDPAFRGREPGPAAEPASR